MPSIIRVHKIKGDLYVKLVDLSEAIRDTREDERSRLATELRLWGSKKKIDQLIVDEAITIIKGRKTDGPDTGVS